MGCWDETCALTSQPIFCGNPVVMVCIDPHRNGMDRVEVSHPFGSQVGDFRCITKIHKGTYDDYGFISELEEEEGKRDRLVKDEEGRDLFLVFFHQDVWERVVELEKTESSFFDQNDYLFHWGLMPKSVDAETGEVTYKVPLSNEAYGLPNYAFEFMHVARFAINIRRDILSGVRWRGHQDWGNDVRRDLILKLSLEHQERSKHEN